MLGLLRLPKPKAALRRLIEGNGYGFEEYIPWTQLVQDYAYLFAMAGILNFSRRDFKA